MHDSSSVLIFFLNLFYKTPVFVSKVPCQPSSSPPSNLLGNCPLVSSCLYLHKDYVAKLHRNKLYVAHDLIFSIKLHLAQEGQVCGEQKNLKVSEKTKRLELMNE